MTSVAAFCPRAAQSRDALCRRRPFCDAEGEEERDETYRAYDRRMSEMPKVGEPAPDFTLPDQAGHEVTLSKLKGKRVVLFFYPKASTPG